jgi:hypothetical protein
MTIEGVRGPTSAGVTDTSTQDTDGHSDAVGEGLLPEPTVEGFSDDSFAALAMLLTKADQQDRTSARQIEDSADQAAMKHANDRVQHMREKADADQSAAFVDGALGILGGACTMGSAAFAQPCPGESGFNDCTALKGAGEASPKAGELFSAMYKGDAGRDDANAAASEAQSQANIRRFNQAHEDVQAANQSIQKVQQFLEQLLSTRNATLLTAAAYKA